MRLEIFNKPGFGRRLRRLLTGELQPMATRVIAPTPEYVPPPADPAPAQPEPESTTTLPEETQP